jgi:hypothetical protein
MPPSAVARAPKIDPREADILGRAKANTWEGLSRMAFAANWDPDKAVDWGRPIELGRVREGWINILHYFYEGEWQGLEIIQRLMNKAAHLFKIPEMVTYYSTQCADEAKHLLVFRKYLEKLDSPPARQRVFDPLVWLATSGPMPVERWILGTYFTETMAGAIFQRTLELEAIDPTGKEMIGLQLKDESRHIAGTKLGIQTLMDHCGPLKTSILRAWWKFFVKLAVKEVRALKPYGDQVGMDPEYILRKCFQKMAEMPEFKAKFLNFEQSQGFLRDP